MNKCFEKVVFMDTAASLLEFFINLDKHINELILYFGEWTYIILFLIIFCETGLFMAPFLPGDSLLFVLGTMAGEGSLSLNKLLIFLMLAAIIGDTLNYRIGRVFGYKLFNKDNVRFFNKKHIVTSGEFYKKHGGKAVILARFLPVVRTFAPFVAGMGKMPYFKFILFNIFGGIAWVSVCVFTGFTFGNIPIIKNNFTLVLLLIVIISSFPGLFTWLKSRKAAGKQKAKKE